MLAFFRTCNEQLDILMDGLDTGAAQRLPHAEVDLIRNHLNRDERITAFAAGRSVGAGRTLWVVTTQSLLVARTSQRPAVRKFALASIEQVGAEQGRYGHGLSALLAGQRLGLYGAARGLALLTLRALNRPAATPATRTLAQTLLDDEEHQSAQHAIADLALRVQPLLAQSDTEARQLLQQTAERARNEGQQRAPESV